MTKLDVNKLINPANIGVPTGASKGTTLDKVLQKILQKNLVQLTLKDDLTISGGTWLNFDTFDEVLTVGDKLTPILKEDETTYGGIEVGAGVEHVKVTLVVGLKSNDTTKHVSGAKIMLNNVDKKMQFTLFPSADQSHLVISNFVLAVKKGDVISAAIIPNASTILHAVRNYFLVEVID